MSGVKHDQGKAPLDLLPHEALTAVAEVLAFGEKKYSAGNWAKGLEYRRLISAAQRHLGAYNSGQDKDEESGLSHVAHAACCLLFLSYMEQKRPDLDNRWAKPEPKKKGPLVLEVGKRYRRRDGKFVTLRLAPANRWLDFEFEAEGFLYKAKMRGEHVSVRDADIIEEA